MVRRLPVYLVIDTSESMAGEALDSMKKGLSSLIGQLSSDPTALETVWVSVITFGRTAQVATPLSDIVTFTLPKLVLGSGTALGAGLKLLEYQLKTEVRKSTREVKGDWNPLVFILTDGEPTDQWQDTADRFRREISGKSANIIALACGNDVDIENLYRITNSVMRLRDDSEASFKAFFEWVSTSVKIGSTKLAAGPAKAMQTPALPPEVTTDRHASHPISDRWKFLLSRCMKTKGLYLIRLHKEPAQPENTGGKPTYSQAAAHPLSDFDFSPNEAAPQISTAQLNTLKPCPCCGNEKISTCFYCKRIICVPGEGDYNCPWCGQENHFVYGSPFDLNAGAG